MGSHSTRNKNGRELALEIGTMHAGLDHATIACLSLWAEVGIKAITDAKVKLRRGERDSWLENSKHNPSSFDFIMHLFGIDPERARNEIKKRTPCIPPPKEYTPSEEARLNLLLEAAFGKKKGKKK